MENKTKFNMELVQNGRHLVYKMDIERNILSYDNSIYHSVTYKYGNKGSGGKSNFKSFHDDSDHEVEEGGTKRKSLEKATEFVTNKYYELWEKGYRDVGSGAFDSIEGSGKGSRPINDVDEVYYMERKDPYCGDESSFFYIHLLKPGPNDHGFYAKTIEGEKGSRGFSAGCYHNTLEEILEAIEEIVQSKKECGYKKKAVPKKLQVLKVVDMYGSEEEDDNDDGDDDDYDRSDSDDERKKKPKKKAPAKKKATKAVVAANTEAAETEVVEEEPHNAKATEEDTKTTEEEKTETVTEVAKAAGGKKRQLPATVVSNVPAKKGGARGGKKGKKAREDDEEDSDDE